jgi:alpha,alpha-trehalase
MENKKTNNLKKIPEKYAKIIKHIDKTWGSLTRNYANIGSHLDPKFDKDPNKVLEIYYPHGEDLNKNNIINKIKQKTKKIKFIKLPKNIKQVLQKDALLYLPYPYVVPGGRFNEMYGWDSYFIILGLLKQNKLELAKGMVENMIYQVKHYGKVLNANRTYYLARSQPPLLSQSILAIYKYTHDKKWLKEQIPVLEKFYYFWTTRPRLQASIGLSRYHSESKDPLPEIVKSYHDQVKKYFREHKVFSYNVKKFYDVKTDTLTPEFYQADRTVRESGFDLTSKFGPFGADITNYIPVSLNCLLYKMECDMALICQKVKDNDGQKTWENRSKARKIQINQYLWEEDLGYYFNFNIRTRVMRPYIFATTFYPLWAGASSEDQAKRLLNNLPILLRQGGIVSSTYATGMQWDAPYGWAPHQYFAVKGLLKYGYNKEAKLIAKRFVDLISSEFNKTGHIFEKYDVINCTSELNQEFKYGYKENVTGFGWTNAIFLEFIEILGYKI